MRGRFVLSLCLLFGIIVSVQAAFLASQQKPPHKSTVESSELTMSSAVQDVRAIQRTAEKQDSAYEIAKSFVPGRFNPHPFLRNNHLQTIGGVFLRSIPGCAYTSRSDHFLSEWNSLASVIYAAILSRADQKQDGSECTYWDERERVDTPDGDFFHVDHKYQSQSSASMGTVVLLHGLESNSNSSLAIDMSTAFHSLGFDVACINNRGCSGEDNIQLGMYHAGFTQDIKQFLSMQKPNQPIYLSGFSLGANQVLKTLGELGSDATDVYNIQGAAVTGAPFDMERNIKFVDAPGFNRKVYAGNFLKTMKKKCHDKLVKHCNGDPDTTVFDYNAVMNAETIAEVENGWLARVHGFKDNIDYYRQVSCGYFLKDITVPTLIVNANDDPFFDPSYFPKEIGCDGDCLAPIKMVRTNHGGHLGYLFHQQDPEQTSPNENIGVSKSMRSTPASSWMPTELARFVHHVHDSVEN